MLQIGPDEGFQLEGVPYHPTNWLDWILLINLHLSGVGKGLNWKLELEPVGLVKHETETHCCTVYTAVHCCTVHLFCCTLCTSSPSETVLKSVNHGQPHPPGTPGTLPPHALPKSMYLYISVGVPRSSPGLRLSYPVSSRNSSQSPEVASQSSPSKRILSGQPLTRPTSDGPPVRTGGWAVGVSAGSLQVFHMCRMLLKGRRVCQLARPTARFNVEPLKYGILRVQSPHPRDVPSASLQKNRSVRNTLSRLSRVSLSLSLCQG